jgi:hypothetical protein
MFIPFSLSNVRVLLLLRMPTARGYGLELFGCQVLGRAEPSQVGTARVGGTAFEASAPQPPFKTRDAAFDVSADGRFLIANQTEQAFASPMTMVLNWPSLLRK